MFAVVKDQGAPKSSPDLWWILVVFCISSKTTKSFGAKSTQSTEAVLDQPDLGVAVRLFFCPRCPHPLLNEVGAYLIKEVSS